MENIEKKCICKDCGEEFIIPATITPLDLVNGGMDPEDVKHLFATRDSIETLLGITTDEDLKAALQLSYNELEAVVVKNSSCNSLEAYDFYGFAEIPSRCENCRTDKKSRLR